jgi:xanthine dehydrogenase accessory factor
MAMHLNFSNTLPGLVRRAAGSDPQEWAMATLVRSEGSSYRRPGARLLVSKNGVCHGVLSGGCLEDEISARAREVIQTGSGPRLLTFDTRLLYGCEGKIEVLVEALGLFASPGCLLGAMAARLQERRPFCIRTVYAGANDLGSSLVAENDAAEDLAGVFIDRVLPPLRVVVLGSGPEIPPLRLFAEGLGWDCVVCAGMNELPGDFTPDPFTAAVVVHHHFGRDFAAMEQLLPMGLPYVGLLGPKKRRAALFDRLQDCPGFDPVGLAGVHAPAGLDLGGDSPEEIALSIMAEIRAVLSGRKGGFLRDRNLPIHERPGMEPARS